MCQITKMYNTHSSRIKSFVQSFVSNRDDAEQITSDSWLKICRVFDNYDPNRKFLTWAFVICQSCISDYYRRKCNNVLCVSEMGSEKTIEEMVLDYRQPMKVLERSENAIKVREAISQLPKKFRACVVKKYFEYKTYKEIAEELDIPIGTVKSRLKQSRNLLKDMLHDIE